MCVGRGSTETRRKSTDALTRGCICTLTHSHTLYVKAGILKALLGVVEGGLKFELFQPLKDFQESPGAAFVIITASVFNF